MTEEGEKLNVVRIKRKRSEQPVDSLLLDLPNPKKSLVDALQSLSTQEKKDDTPEPKVFRLVGTVTSHDTPARLKEKIKEAQQKRKLMLLPHPPDTTEAHREKQKKLNKDARKKEIKLFRDSERSNTAEEFSDFFHLVDLVKADETIDSTDKAKTTHSRQKEPTQKSTTKNKNKDKDSPSTLEETIMCNYLPMVREYLSAHEVPLRKDDESDDEDFVYDVYYNDNAVSEAMDEDMAVARIESFDEELTLENEYDAGDTDSDDEENRTTDIYPDEDEDPEFEAQFGTSSEEYDEGESSGDEDVDGEGSNSKGTGYYW